MDKQLARKFLKNRNIYRIGVADLMRLGCYSKAKLFSFNNIKDKSNDPNWPLIKKLKLMNKELNEILKLNENLCFRLFRKKLSELTPEEMTIYKRVSKRWKVHRNEYEDSLYDSALDKFLLAQDEYNKEWNSRYNYQMLCERI